MRRRLRQSPPFLPFSTGIFLFFSPLPPPSAAPPPPPPPPLPLHFLFPRSSTSTSFPSSTGSTLTKSAFPSNFFRSRTRRYHRPPRPFSSFLPRADRAAERKRAGKLKLYRRFFRFLSTARRFPYQACEPKATRRAGRLTNTRVLIPTHPRLLSRPASGRRTNRI